jgi:hypothetical protein
VVPRRAPPGPPAGKGRDRLGRRTCEPMIALVPRDESTSIIDVTGGGTRRVRRRARSRGIADRCVGTRARCGGRRGQAGLRGVRARTRELAGGSARRRIVGGPVSPPGESELRARTGWRRLGTKGRARSGWTSDDGAACPRASHPLLHRAPLSRMRAASAPNPMGTAVPRRVRNVWSPHGCGRSAPGERP